MFFRIFIILCAAAGLYAAYEIFGAQRHYHAIQTPQADFMVMNKDTGSISVIQFMDLNDADSKKNNLFLMDYAATHPEILYMVRPVFRTGTEEGEVRGLFAAGLQNKYWELLRLISNYDGELNEEFLKENADLIELDVERMKKDFASAQVAELLEKNRDSVDKSGVKSTQSLMVGRNIYYLEAPLTTADIERMAGNE